MTKDKLQEGVTYHFDMVPSGSVEGKVKEKRESCFIVTLSGGNGVSVLYNKIWNYYKI